MCRNILQLMTVHQIILLLCCVTMIKNERMFFREMWMVNQQQSVENRLQRPIKYVVIEEFFGEGKKSCYSTLECILMLNVIYAKDLKIWGDIGYNFLIDGNGNIFEGRGWYHEGYAIKSFNHLCISIAFIGNITDYSHQVRLRDGLNELTTRGIGHGFLTEDYSLLTSYQIMNKPRNSLETNDKIHFPFYNVISRHERWLNASVTFRIMEIETVEYKEKLT